MSAWTLALDTATVDTVVAAVCGEDTDARREAPGPNGRPAHSSRLLVLADAARVAVGARWEDLGRIVVGTGPGSFTGVRVGVATARALALARGAQLHGVPTPAALAQRAQGPGGPASGAMALVVQDARRGELFLTLVAANGLPAGARELVPVTVPRERLASGAEALGLDPERPSVALGDAAPALRAELEGLGLRVPADPAWHVVDGLALARVGAALVPQAPRDVTPVYVREADAIPTARRR